MLEVFRSDAAYQQCAAQLSKGLQQCQGSSQCAGLLCVFGIELALLASKKSAWRSFRRSGARIDAAVVTVAASDEAAEAA